MIERGGSDEERLYIYDFRCKLGREEIVFKATDMPDMRSILHRHMGRYMLPAFFTRPDMRVLDFPCGSGYAYPLFGKNCRYEGMDNDEVTIHYAKKHYYDSDKVFMVRDLTKPSLKAKNYDVIACIEGIEHIDQKYQGSLIANFFNALKPKGVLVVTTPQAKKSGKSDNPYHKWELSEDDFLDILAESFDDVDILKTEDTIHNGNKQTMMYAICRRG